MDSCYTVEKEKDATEQQQQTTGEGTNNILNYVGAPNNKNLFMLYRGLDTPQYVHFHSNICLKRLTIIFVSIVLHLLSLLLVLFSTPKFSWNQKMSVNENQELCTYEFRSVTTLTWFLRLFILLYGLLHCLSLLLETFAWTIKWEDKSSQVKYIYIALFTIQKASKLLHTINQNNLTVFVYYWKKDIQVW